MAEPLVVIKQGELKGVTDTDLNGERYYKFLGIPYAKPPVGPLRFKAPQPPDSWTGVRDAAKEGSGNVCLNIMTNNSIAGSEDCLYLNVFTKELPKAELSHKPVMVFIHGGAFTMGSGSELIQGSKYLVAEDIVLVNINYRLGIFGFLSSDDLSLEIPGNAGLKDQTFALKWVKENISSFNGDPNNITIFGVSAGGASVHFQVLSQTSKGLFHKAIAQSGSALNPWAYGQKNIIQVAEKLGVQVSNDKEALEVLMNATEVEIYEAAAKIPDEILSAKIRRPFGPVIEKPNPTAFLTENPTDLLASGKFNQVPLIQGFTSNEGLIGEFTIAGIGLKVKPTEMGVLWNLGIKENSQKNSELKAKINNFYFENGVTREATQKLVGDLGFTVGIIQSTKLAAKTSKTHVYFYVFSYETTLGTMGLKFMGIEDLNVKGVAHGGEQPYLFNSFLDAALPADQKLLEERNVGIKIVTKIWADFARTGRPHELWEPVTDENELKYFDICQDSKLKINPFSERVAFWEDVLKEEQFNPKIQETPSF